MIFVFPMGTPLLYSLLLRKHWPVISKLQRKEMRGVGHKKLAELKHGSSSNLTLADLEEDEKDSLRAEDGGKAHAEALAKLPGYVCWIIEPYRRRALFHRRSPKSTDGLTRVPRELPAS
jgi:hypothetical protein